MDNRNSTIEKNALTPDNRQFYQQGGFLIAPGLFSPGEIAELKTETAAIFRGRRGPVDGLLPVNPGESDHDVLKKYTAIHFPHKLSPLIRQYLSHPGILDILTAIISPNLKCMQSMLFVKGPGKAGQSWHQDEYYIPTRDRSLTGAWIAIDDATVDNGCLWIIPGRPGPLLQRIPNHNDEYADTDTVDTAGIHPDRMLPVEVKSGSVVFFNGYTLHSSRRNHTAGNFRTALVNHYMSAESMLPWDQDGKLPPTGDNRDIVLVAGQDPYAWKGIADLNKPYLRPDILDIKPTR